MSIRSHDEVRRHVIEPGKRPAVSANTRATPCSRNMSELRVVGTTRTAPRSWRTRIGGLSVKVPATDVAVASLCKLGPAASVGRGSNSRECPEAGAGQCGDLGQLPQEGPSLPPVRSGPEAKKLASPPPAR